MKVEPIPGEPFRYHVGSRSTGGTHMVCLAEGACSCIGWTTRQKAYKKMTGKDYECAHIKACWQELKDAIKAKYGTKTLPQTNRVQPTLNVPEPNRESARR